MNLKKDHKTIECSIVYVIESRDYCIVNNAKPKFKKNNHGIVLKSMEKFLTRD